MISRTKITRIPVDETKSRRERIIEGMAIWASYYRENIDRFVVEYLGMTNLKWFQLVLLAMMNCSRTFLWIASRGMGKSYLVAIFAVCRCILYPGTKVVVTSGIRSQSINVLEKIQTELIPGSPNLQNEIDMSNTKFSGQDAKVSFKNGSFIKVVTASDSARSNRANLLIVDEFRLVRKDTIDTVLRKFLTSRRMPKYTELTPAQRKTEYAKEPNMTCYLSSAYFKDHWSYTKTVDTFKLMFDDTKSDFCCGLPYELSIQEGLLFPEDIEGEMLESDFNEIKWGMEMEGLFWGGENDSFFDYPSVAKTRNIKFAMLPDEVSTLIPGNKFKIPPKQPGEKRILSADIALMASKKHNNDATSVFINQLVPTKSGRYMNNIVYGDTFEGMNTVDQTLVIRKLYEEFACDYIVLDCAGSGLGIFDLLIRDIIDPDTGEVYPALGCCNDPAMAERCIRDADKVIWSIKANAVFNSECAVLLREGFRSGRLRLPISEFDLDVELSENKSYMSLSPEDKLRIQLPYINTTLLINELTKLQHEESAGRVRLFERSGMRKDRYSSLSYNYYVSSQLEAKLNRNKRNEINADTIFMYRAPKIK